MLFNGRNFCSCVEERIKKTPCFCTASKNGGNTFSESGRLGGGGEELRWKLMVRKNITLAWPGVTNDKKVEAGLGNKALVVSSMYFRGRGK